LDPRQYFQSIHKGLQLFRSELRKESTAAEEMHQLPACHGALILRGSFGLLYFRNRFPTANMHITLRKANVKTAPSEIRFPLTRRKREEVRRKKDNMIQ